MNLYLAIPQRRDRPAVTDLAFVTGATSRAAMIAGVLACHNPFGGNSKAETSTSTTDNRIATTGLGTTVAGGSTQVKDQGVLVTDNASLLAPGSTQVANSTVDIKGASDELVKTVLQSVTDVSKNATDAAAEGQTKLADILSGAVGQIKDLAESKQTEGEAQRNKIMLLVVLGLLVMLAFVFRKR